MRLNDKNGAINVVILCLTFFKIDILPSASLYLFSVKILSSASFFLPKIVSNSITHTCNINFTGTPANPLRLERHTFYESIGDIPHKVTSLLMGLVALYGLWQYFKYIILFCKLGQCMYTCTVRWLATYSPKYKSQFFLKVFRKRVVFKKSQIFFRRQLPCK